MSCLCASKIRRFQGYLQGCPTLWKTGGTLFFAAPTETRAEQQRAFNMPFSQICPLSTSPYQGEARSFQHWQLTGDFKPPGSTLTCAMSQNLLNCGGMIPSMGTFTLVQDPLILMDTSCTGVLHPTTFELRRSRLGRPD